MIEPGRRQPWARTAVLVGLFYLVVGLVTAELAGAAGSHRGVLLWRWSAWLTSAVAFALHIAHEQLRRRNLPRATALHAAAAVAIGAGGLAAAATAHAWFVGFPDRNPLRFALAIVAWPALTALPAFLVAWVVAALARRFAGRA